MNGQARGEGEPFERRSPARAARAARARARALHPAGSARDDSDQVLRDAASIRDELVALQREVEELRGWCLGLKVREARIAAVLTVAAAVIEGPRLLRRLLALAALDELGVDRGE